ncbi:unnamed protein product [Effrenium voratum]|nr:unnamed protein product [Effrenium voratum]
MEQAMADALSLEDERARHHARRFREKSAAAVLHRYELQRTQMSRPQLEQHAFHVASWLVALPEDEVMQHHNGLSVVTLFVRYLESLDGPDDRPAGARLARILARVSQNILCLPGDDPVVIQLQQQISKHTPLEELVPKHRSLADEKGAECEDVEAKAVRLMQRAIQRWQNSGCRETYVNSLEQELAESEDPATLRRILRRAVAALSPPRRKGNGNNLLACSSSQSELQSRLRSLVLACLDGLDLTDSSLAPALRCLQAHVQKFQELLVSESSAPDGLSDRCIGHFDRFYMVPAWDPTTKPRERSEPQPLELLPLSAAEPLLLPDADAGLAQLMEVAAVLVPDRFVDTSHPAMTETVMQFLERNGIVHSFNRGSLLTVLAAWSSAPEQLKPLMARCQRLAPAQRHLLRASGGIM